MVQKQSTTLKKLIFTRKNIEYNKSSRQSLHTYSNDGIALSNIAIGLNENIAVERKICNMRIQLKLFKKKVMFHLELFKKFKINFSPLK